MQFLDAYDADWVGLAGRRVIETSEGRQRLVRAVDAYTRVYRKGCTPPGSTTWDAALDNNEAFLAQQVVMTLNNSLSIPNALRRERPDDYFNNTATIEWPLGPNGEIFPIRGMFYGAAVFRDGRHVDSAKAFVRFMIAEGWLAHYLDFAGEWMLPPMPKLLNAPFWLDPSDPHRMAAEIQIASRPMQHYADCNWRYDQVFRENVWGNAVHRVAAEGISPEQAVDEAIARIKEILAE
jgi:multiple sugar transport system substrate-binding protein